MATDAVADAAAALILDDVVPVQEENVVVVESISSNAGQRLASAEPLRLALRRSSGLALRKMFGNQSKI